MPVKLSVSLTVAWQPDCHATCHATIMPHAKPMKHDFMPNHANHAKNDKQLTAWTNCFVGIFAGLCCAQPETDAPWGLRAGFCDLKNFQDYEAKIYCLPAFLLVSLIGVVSAIFHVLACAGQFGIVVDLFRATFSNLYIPSTQVCCCADGKKQ